ncbi:MAG: J domain-containing protein [Planctomycetaceae bacterium]
MLDPYTVLDLNNDADDAQVRSRYLQLVRQFPPEKDPQKFAEIRSAYDALRDPLQRLKDQLFGARVTRTLDSLLEERRPDVRRQRLPTGLLLSLGQD